MRRIGVQLDPGPLPMERLKTPLVVIQPGD
jgi:hypothetical protein